MTNTTFEAVLQNVCVYIYTPTKHFLKKINGRVKRYLSSSVTLKVYKSFMTIGLSFYSTMAGNATHKGNSLFPT